MGAISRDAVRESNDVQSQKVPLPEWGADSYVIVRGLSGTDRDSWELACIAQRKSLGIDAGGFPGIRASLVVRCCFDDEGKRVFEDSDAEWLGTKSGKALDRIWTAAATLSGITEEDAEKLKNG